MEMSKITIFPQIFEKRFRICFYSSVKVSLSHSWSFTKGYFTEI